MEGSIREFLVNTSFERQKKLISMVRSISIPLRKNKRQTFQSVQHLPPISWCMQCHVQVSFLAFREIISFLNISRISLVPSHHQVALSTSSACSFSNSDPSFLKTFASSTWDPVISVFQPNCLSEISHNFCQLVSFANL